MKKISTLHYFYLVACLIPLAVYIQPDWASDISYKVPGISRAIWIILILVGVLGLKLNQTRLLLSSLYFIATYYLLESILDKSLLGLRDWALADALGVALPLSLIINFGFPEAALLNQKTYLRLGLSLLPILFLAALFKTAPESFKSLMDWNHFPKGIFNWAPSVLLAWLLLLAAAILNPDTKIRPFAHALAFSILPLLLALGLSPHPDPKDTAKFNSHFAILALCFLGVSIMQGMAIFAMYWQRVYLDELTAIPNRRALDEKLQSLSAPYALAMADIDHFKKFNDSYGHEEGDNVLRLVAAHLKHESGGRAYRYGGEEFCLIFQGWETERAENLCAYICRSLAKRKFAIRLPDKIRKKTSPKDRGSLKARTENVTITLSLGVAGPDNQRKNPQEVIKLSDQGLYKAKENGRNQVVRQN